MSMGLRNKFAMCSDEGCTSEHIAKHFNAVICEHGFDGEFINEQHVTDARLIPYEKIHVATIGDDFVYLQYRRKTQDMILLCDDDNRRLLNAAINIRLSDHGGVQCTIYDYQHHIEYLIKILKRNAKVCTRPGLANI